MRVSIITVSFNAEKTIRDTIQSVVSQNYPQIEYVIIDGASKDNTISIIKSFGNAITRLVSEPDNGIYDGMNKGIDLASGDIIGILNADDFYSDTAVISKVVDVFNSKNVDAVYGDLDYVDQHDTARVVRKWKSGIYYKDAFLKGWMPPHPTFFVRKSCYEKYGRFTNKLKSAADYELMLRFIHKHQINIAYLPQVLVKMRAGGKSNASIKNRIKANREDKLAWKLNDLKPELFTFIRKPISKLTQFFKR
ncbi:MAG: glycosyltransferase [Crocinitomicaceae bacterium]|nr:glycosyltransferase [Crocinitomicaceae bacterium]